MDNLYMYSDDTEWVIAYSEEDATKIFIEHIGYSEEDLKDIEWYKMDPQSTFTYYYDDAPPGEDKPPGRRAFKAGSDGRDWMVRATVAEWIELRGRGFFATTDW